MEFSRGKSVSKIKVFNQRKIRTGREVSRVQSKRLLEEVHVWVISGATHPLVYYLLLSMRYKREEK